MTRLESRRATTLKKLGVCEPFVAASLNQVTRRCGNPNCKCAKGQPHQAHTLTFKVKGKTKSIHVPKALVPEVKEWVRAYKRLKKLIQEISNDSVAIIRGYVPAQRRAVQKATRSDK